MKRATIVLISLLLFPTLASANSCPALLHQIDEILASKPDLDEETIFDEENAKNVKQLRDQGEELHKSGEHTESVKVLQRALELLENEV